MPDWLLNRPLIIGLAITGGVLSMLVSWCQSRAILSERLVIWLNKASYGFMTVSIILFIAAGLLGSDK
jgi:H+/Cl- antiporter ClcA